jgi:Archaeal/vacuolar-type H+-ATPase subunit C
MGNLLAYSGLITKVRAMQAKLLTENDIRNIASLPQTSDIVSYLLNKPAYNPVFSNLNADLIHRGNIEKLLILSFYNDYTKLYRFAGMQQKQFLKLYLKHLEIDLINYCLRIIFNHYEFPFDLDYKKPFFDRFSQLSIDQLITSKSIHEFIDNLKGTEYYEPLHLIRESGVATLFDYDLALELYSFSAVWKKSKLVLQKQELKLFTHNYGSKIDLLNLQWIYRSKKYDNMLPPDIYALLIPISHHINTKTMRALVESPTITEFISLVKQTYYGKRYDFEKDTPLEHMYEDFMHHLYLTNRRRDPHSIAVVSTYLFLKEREIQRLTTLLECVRYNLSPSETLAYVGGITP